MIGFVVVLYFNTRVKSFSIRAKCRPAEAVRRGGQTRWFTAVCGDPEERRVCFGVGGCISVGRCDEDDCIPFRCPDRIELIARIADASGEAAFTYQLCTGEQIFCFRSGLCRLNEQVRLCVFNPLVPVTNRKLLVDACAIFLRLAFSRDFLVCLIITGARINRTREQQRSAVRAPLRRTSAGGKGSDSHCLTTACDIQHVNLAHFIAFTPR